VELKEFTYQAGWTSNRVIESRRGVLVRVLAAYAKLFRFVQQPSAQAAFLSARKSVFRTRRNASMSPSGTTCRRSGLLHRI